MAYQPLPAVAGTPPPAYVQYQAAPIGYGGPPQQQMAMPGPESFLAGSQAIFVRQKLQVLGSLFACCEKNNEYIIFHADVPTANRRPPLKDEEYFRQPQIGFIQEKGSCFCRVCCGPFRETKLGVYGSRERAKVPAMGDELPPVDFIRIERPFKLTIPCFCCMICPQEASFFTPRGAPLGSSIWDWRCCAAICMGQYYLAVRDQQNAIKYYLRPQYPTLCNGFRNCFAPTCCNEVWEADIIDARSDTVVGNYKNNYPGMIGLRCCLQANNFSLTFPGDATAEDKQRILGALMLAEFVFHERSAEGKIDQLAA